MPVAGRSRTDTGAVVTELGGYRLLRMIGVGPRAEVFLAHPQRADAEMVPVVIKVYGTAVTDESVVAEIEALSRAAGDHVMRVLDVTSTVDGAPALVLARHAAATLARIQGDRSLAPGEAVTVLAPLATALARMHAAGVAHGGIGPGAVLFDATGSPTLACFGRATLFAPGLPVAGLENEQAVLADVLAFGSLAATILEAAGATALAGEARTNAAPGAWLSGFADEIFDLAAPLPVDLRPPQEPVLLPARVIAAHPVVFPDAPVPTPRWRELLDGARQSLARVRRPVWIAAGVAFAGLVFALVAIPQGSTTATVQPSASPTPAPIERGPVAGDDPVAATLVLFATREACIRDLSAECLDDVDEAGSGAWDADRALVGAILDGVQTGSVPDVDPATVELMQRLGDSALVSLGPDSEPASVLLVKGEAGWRIRDYLEE